VLHFEDLPHCLKGFANDSIRDGCIGLAGLCRRENVRQQARACDETHLPGRIPCPVEEVLMVGGRADDLTDLLADGGVIAERDAEGRVDERIKHVRGLGHRIGQSRSGAKQVGETKAQAIMRLQDGEKLHGGRHPAESAVEGCQCAIGVGRPS
jgi:hypothetical protein